MLLAITVAGYCTVPVTVKLLSPRKKAKNHIFKLQLPNVLPTNVIPTAASEFRLRWLSVLCCSACNTSGALLWSVAAYLLVG